MVQGIAKDFTHLQMTIANIIKLYSTISVCMAFHCVNVFKQLQKVTVYSVTSLVLQYL